MAGSLTPLAPGVLAWIDDIGAHGHSNAGVVVAADGLTVIDSLTTPAQAGDFAAAIGELTDLPVRRMAFTCSHIEHVGGSSVFPLAAVYGTGQTSAHLDQPGNPDGWARLHPEHADAFPGLETRSVTHTVTEPAHLCPASIAVPVGGFQFETLIVQVPATGVVFAGATASFGSVPLGFDADFAAWIDTLGRLRELGEIFVPGHGPLGGRAELDNLRDYLAACIDARGDVSGLADGPWMTWSDQEYHPINVERAAMLAAGDPSPPPSLERLLAST